MRIPSSSLEDAGIDDIRNRGRRLRLDETAAEILKLMNPFPLGNPGGICATCATETARVLTEGKDAQPIIAAHHADDTFEEFFSRSEYVYQDSGTAEKVFAPDVPNRSNVVWKWLQSEAFVNRVYIAKGGGHVWNFVKDGQHIYLIDMSMRLFRVVRKEQDCSARYMNYATPASQNANILFDYCDPVDLGDAATRKKLTIFPCTGVLNPRWLAERPPRP